MRNFSRENGNFSEKNVIQKSWLVREKLFRPQTRRQVSATDKIIIQEEVPASHPYTSLSSSAVSTIVPYNHAFINLQLRLTIWQLTLCWPPKDTLVLSLQLSLNSPARLITRLSRYYVLYLHIHD